MTAMAIPTAVVPLTDVFTLRWEVLRPGLPRESAPFPEDAGPGAFHVAAYGPGPAGTEVLGCASFYPEPFPGPDGPPGTAYRIRGMASAASARGLGYGTAVLAAGTAEAAARGAKALWCNGRTEARAFYERHGYRVYGEEFVIEGVGPHYVLARELSD
ncbi:MULTISPECIES: GNAT family N-acetyltransferase [unclassified Streptomyces]|uniref:GNAT family N-acetyltransferase n=1 Tax=unclassified Streptomyces TaxID=2593676 RepID=UPI0022B70A38|nr:MULTISPECIES: GNAT family N-acetyltransferase [unclassified Streptomyces]MCZ7414094.1 GNAT family N-acetyltransferase [Streptomyces sp. WMMC897]MCZ7431089.1 GNAT family N-acetyltransferase [Streptomyces sp. WMMC1477]